MLLHAGGLERKVRDHVSNGTELTTVGEKRICFLSGQGKKNYEEGASKKDDNQCRRIENSK